jgi:hypothetical protein
MSAAQKWVLRGGTLALLLVVLFPPWQQIYQGHPLAYRGEMGHHFFWLRPNPVGEQSWMVNAPASECKVVVKRGVILRQCGMVAGMIAILLFAFRKHTSGQPSGSGLETTSAPAIIASLKTRRLMLISLFLALCLPVPPPDGIPLGALVVMAPLSLFSDNGHLGPWYVPLIASASLAIYFTPVFLVLSGVAWLARRRARTAASG